MKKNLLIVLSVILIIALSTVCLSGCKKPTSKYVSHNMKVGADGTFKILQLTDIHLINSEVTSKNVAKDYSLRDGWAFTAVRTVIEETDPDLIMVTGDSTFTLDLIKMFTRTNDNYEAFKKFARFIDSFNTPWAFVFGNHDEEGSLRTRMQGPDGAKKALGEYLMSDEIRNCLYVHGPEEITGRGNYVINVLNKDGTVNNSLVMLDSGSYLMDVDPATGKEYADQQSYEYVHDDQLDWYEAAIKDISDIEGKKVSSVIFQHIPMPEYKTALHAYIDALSEAGENWQDTIKADGTERKMATAEGDITYHFGIYNDTDVCCSFVGEFMGKTYDGGHEFERIQKVGSTKYVFCGHDHKNTFSLTYKGIRLSYGMSIDYSANGIVPSPPAEHEQTIFDETVQRGGTLITLKKDSSVEIKQVPFTRNLYRETLEARNG